MSQLQRATKTQFSDIRQAHLAPAENQISVKIRLENRYLLV